MLSRKRLRRTLRLCQLYEARSLYSSLPTRHSANKRLLRLPEVDPETEAMLASYKDIIRSQAQELQQLHSQVSDLTEQLSKPPPPPPVEPPVEVPAVTFGG